jgi:hypothetical protein
LISTGVTAASYTAASITVDADGRITAASSGSAGAGAFIPTRVSIGPTSGTHTAAANANRLGVYLFAAGGGGGSGRSDGMEMLATGGSGGRGGFGFYNKPITQPFSQPFTLGAAGNAGPMANAQAGNAGGNAVFTNVGTSNGGGGSPSPGSGSAGNTDATFTYPYTDFVVGMNFAGGGPGSFNNTAGPGSPSAIVVFENTGT